MKKITQEKINEIVSQYRSFGYGRDQVTLGEIPIIKNLETKIYESIKTAPKRFDVDQWHGIAESDFTSWGKDFLDADDFISEQSALEKYKECGTTHCRAGWAILHGGKKAVALEKKVGPECAGALIYFKNKGRIPEFRYVTNSEARASIRKGARREQAVTKKVGTK